MPLTAGERLGPYEVLALIGAGGMGEVWKARDTRLDRVVAIKVSQERFSDRFEREARAVAALNHPRICTLHDVGPNYLVMEYVEGTPLKGPLPLEKAVEYAGQILDALDAAHQKSIIHRDLKPANILVTKQGIKLLDFGLAKHAAPLKEVDVTRALTNQGQILGTLQYMSPEQLQGKEADARSDLFGFGCVLYEMLSGKRAFDGSSAASVIAAILEREPVPLEASPPLDHVLRRSLAKDPDQRFQTARDLKATVTWAVKQPLATGAVKQSRRWWIAIAAVAAGGIITGWAVSHFRQLPADERVFRLQINPPEGGRFVFGVRSGGIALSPDGRTAAFVASVGGKNGLWIRPLDSTTARLLVSASDVMAPFWSPDSKSVGFFAGGKLQRAELAGGAPFTICDVAGAARGGSWSSDGRIIFANLASTGLFQVPASGGSPSRLTTRNASRGESFHLWPQVVAHGHFLYWARSDKENTGIYAASFVKPGEPVRLLNSDTNALYAPGSDGRDYLLWLRGGTLLAQEFDASTLRLAGEPHPVADPVSQVGLSGPQLNVAVSTSGQLLYSAANTTGQFTWLDRGGKQMGVVGEPGEYTQFRLSPDGNRVVSARSRRGGSDLWLLDVKRGASGRFTDAGINAHTYPVWSPNRRTIAFHATLPGGFRLLFKEADTAEGEQHTIESRYLCFPLDWSRDGRFILYAEVAPGTGNDIWILPLRPDGRPAEGIKPTPYLRTPFYEGSGRFSPETNPRWVAYVSDESGRIEVYVDTFPAPRHKTPISTGGGQYPEWGAGGRELYYVSPEFKLMAVSLKLGTGSVEPSAPRELFTLPAVDTGFTPMKPLPTASVSWFAPRRSNKPRSR
jgi:Tol biopolymer transport system component/predicted Ser/Thr protein kinase